MVDGEIEVKIEGPLKVWNLGRWRNEDRLVQAVGRGAEGRSGYRTSLEGVE